VDIDQIAITSDAQNLYFLVRMTDITTTVGQGAPQVQFAIDIDGVPGSGQTFFRGLADTDVAAGVAWEFLVQTRFGSGNGAPAVWNTAGIDVAAGALEVIDLDQFLVPGQRAPGRAAPLHGRELPVGGERRHARNPRPVQRARRGEQLR
jgi:hypothetical protein